MKIGIPLTRLIPPLFMPVPSQDIDFQRQMSLSPLFVVFVYIPIQIMFDLNPSLLFCDFYIKLLKMTLNLIDARNERSIVFIYIAKICQIKGSS
jgi:hypothetical protein